MSFPSLFLFSKLSFSLLPSCVHCFCGLFVWFCHLKTGQKRCYGRNRNDLSLRSTFEWVPCPTEPLAGCSTMAVMGAAATTVEQVMTTIKARRRRSHRRHLHRHRPRRHLPDAAGMTEAEPQLLVIDLPTWLSPSYPSVSFFPLFSLISAPAGFQAPAGASCKLPETSFHAPACDSSWFFSPSITFLVTFLISQLGKVTWCF